MSCSGVQFSNDIDNCGHCGNVCSGAHPYCDHGTCASAPPCNADAGACGAGLFCCGANCCAAGELCCEVPSGIVPTPQCYPPDNGTCPKGCLTPCP
jgi:hypothetical protein